MMPENILEGNFDNNVDFLKMHDALLANHLRRYFLDICQILGVESLQLTVDGQKIVEQAIGEIRNATRHHIVTSAPEGTLIN